MTQPFELPSGVAHAFFGRCGDFSFGHALVPCSNHGECEAVCPKEISITHIAQMRRDYFAQLMQP